MANNYANVQRDLAALAQEQASIRALAVIGSRALGVADRAADLDVLVVADDVQALAGDQRWLAPLGRIWVYANEAGPDGSAFKSILFDDAVALDLVIVPAGWDPAAGGDVAAWALRGHIMLKDQVDLAGRLAAAKELVPPAGQADRPSQDDFAGLVARFWIDAVRAVKRLDRGELWAAKQLVDYQMKTALVRMAAWRSAAMAGGDLDTYWDGRHLEAWADARMLHDLHGIFADYEADHIGQALFGTMDAFRLVAIETAGRCGLEYPEMADRKATVWVRTWQEPK